MKKKMKMEGPMMMDKMGEPMMLEVSKKTKGKMKQREGDKRVKKSSHKFFGLGD